MPKLKNKLPTYRVHKASGQAVVTLNGRDIYLGKPLPACGAVAPRPRRVSLSSPSRTKSSMRSYHMSIDMSRR